MDSTTTLNPVSRIILEKSHFKNDLDLRVAQQLRILMEAGEICTVFPADSKAETIIIEHVPFDPLKGQPFPFHLYPDEARHISIYIAKKNIYQAELDIEELEDSLEILEQSEEEDRKERMSRKKNRGNLS